MKKFKKLIALACVATMVISPMTALADEVKSENDSVIENDNSKAPVYTAVELPTITNGTYDFSIDRDKLLEDYDYEGVYGTDSHVYFNATLEKAKLAHGTADTDDTTYALYKKVFTVDTTQADDASPVNGAFIAALGTPDADLTHAKEEIVNAEKAIYYVWQPVDYTGDDEHAAEARGHYVKIDADNIVNIVEVEVGGTTDSPSYTYILKEDHDSGSFIWDGNIYKEAYVQLDAEAAVDYVTATKNEGVDTYTVTPKDATGTNPEAALYLGTTTSGSTTYTIVSDGTTLDYTPATYQYKDESDAATVENKSTTPIVVKVQINVDDDEGITYAEADDVVDTENASLYLAIHSGSNIAAVKDGNATAYYVLDGATNKTMVYQLADTVTATGSHKYAQFELPGAEYKDVSFTIKADVNESDDADAAWDAYIDSLTASENPNTKPTIEVVYSWVEVEATDNENEYVDADENLYTTDGTTGWAESGSAHTHTFTDYTDLTCDGEDCDYERTSQIATPLTLTKGSSSYYCAGFDAAATITSQTVYGANEYASKGASATSLATTTAGFIKTSSGAYNIATADYNTLVADLEAGTYVLAIVTSAGTYTVIITVS